MHCQSTIIAGIIKCMPATKSKRRIEERLKVIESEIAALKAAASLSPHTHPVYALERLHGTFENDKILREAMKIGRQWRTSDGLKARASRVGRT